MSTDAALAPKRRKLARDPKEEAKDLESSFGSETPRLKEYRLLLKDYYNTLVPPLACSFPNGKNSTKPPRRKSPCASKTYSNFDFKDFTKGKQNYQSFFVRIISSK
jgi:hypothetical protein